MADLTHLAHLLPALDRLIEAVSAEAKDRAVRPLENRLRRGLVAMWGEQRRMTLERLPEFRHRFQEALSDDELDRLWLAVTLATEGPMQNLLDELAPVAMRRGHQATTAEIPASARTGISFDLQHPRAVEFLRNRGAERVTMIDNTTRDRLRTVLTQAGDEGWSYSRTARQIRDTFSGFGGRSPLLHIRDRAELVAVQEMALAYGEGQRIAREEIMADGTVLEKSWLTAGDSRVDADCSANAAAGWIPAGDTFPTGHGQEPAHPGCFPAGVLVGGPTATASSERWFEGDLVELVTASGVKLAATPNHPILTPEGWVPAGNLDRGRHIVRSALSQGMPTTIHPDHDHQPPLIEEVACALGGSPSVMTVRVPTTAEDFHGDGLDGEVAVVRSHGLLRHGFQPTISEPASQQRLRWRYMILSALPTLRRFAFSFPGLRRTSRRVVRRVGIAPVFFGGSFGHHASVGFVNTAPIDTGHVEATVDNAPADAVRLGQRVAGLSGGVPSSDLLDGEVGIEAGAASLGSRGALGRRDAALTKVDEDSGAADAQLALDLLVGRSGPVETDQVIDHRRRRFSGHVYNLQTEGGWYTANGFIVHNCRCTTASRVAEESRVPTPAAA